MVQVDVAPGKARVEFEDSAGREVFGECGTLDKDAHTPGNLDEMFIQATPEQGNGPCGGPDQSGDDVQGGAFAGAVGAQQTHDFSCLHMEGEVVHGNRLTVVF